MGVLDEVEYGDDIFSDHEEEQTSSPKERKITLLQMINSSMKKNIQKQSEQIQALQSENIDLKKEVENYKLLLAEGNETNTAVVHRVEDSDDIKVKEVESNTKGALVNETVDIDSLRQQITAL